MAALASPAPQQPPPPPVSVLAQFAVPLNPVTGLFPNATVNVRVGALIADPPRSLFYTLDASSGSLDAFRQAVPDEAYQTFVSHAFQAIDNANAWEVLHCRLGIYDSHVTVGRLPHYGTLDKLAERSLGHALTPVGVLAALGIPPADVRVTTLVAALKHYLIARQLGDDMRDWEEDLRAGQCSYVVAALLAACAIPEGVHALDPLVAALQAEAWEHTLVSVGQEVLGSLARSRALLKKSQLVLLGSPVSRLLEDLQGATLRTLADHADAKTFLKSYNA